MKKQNHAQKTQHSQPTNICCFLSWKCCSLLEMFRPKVVWSQSKQQIDNEVAERMIMWLLMITKFVFMCFRREFEFFFLEENLSFGKTEQKFRNYFPALMLFHLSNNKQICYYFNWIKANLICVGISLFYFVLFNFYLIIIFCCSCCVCNIEQTADRIWNGLKQRLYEDWNKNVCYTKVIYLQFLFGVSGKTKHTQINTNALGAAEGNKKIKP